MNAQMSKHRVDPPTPMIFDRTKSPATRARACLCDPRVNLVMADFRLHSSYQVLAAFVRDTEVSLRTQLGTLNVTDHYRIQNARFINVFKLQCPFHREVPPFRNFLTAVLSRQTPNFFLVSS